MSEKEYIERGALIKDIEVNQRNTEHHKDGRGKQIHVGEHRHFIRMVHEQPAADVAPVVHGEWIYHECVSSYDGAISGFSCSECCSFVDEEIFDSDGIHKNFCGHCGAKMDGGKEQNDGFM